MITIMKNLFLLFCVFFLVFFHPSFASDGNLKIESFNKSKKILRDIHKEHSLTFYCQCKYKDKKPNWKSCGFTPRKDKKRASRIEWEQWLLFCYITKKDLENSIIYIDRLIQDAPHNRLFGFKASILALQGKIEESKDWLKKFTDERPEIKSLGDYYKVAPEMSETLRNNLLEGMELAGLPK